MNHLRLLILSLFALLLLHMLPVLNTHAADRDFSKTITGLSPNAGIIAVKGDTVFFSQHPDDSYVPASIIKIATAFSALTVLGPQYRFTTAFFQNREGDLYIKGKGDPFLISEEVALIIERLQEAGLTRIENILIDDSAFELAAQADGAGASLNPYDVANNALAVNFNTLPITVSSDRTTTSSEPQTPTIELMRQEGKKLSPGTHRINISRKKKNIHIYAGQLFRALQKRADIPGNGSIERRKTPAGMKPLYIHTSTRPLIEIISKMMLYSNNFIANQLFLTVGANKKGYPATWEKARAATSELLLADLGLGKSQIVMHEGSGLSRKNRITPRAMITLLKAFRKYGETLPEESGLLIKSGTLTGVYAYAGYFSDKNNLDPFVLILNRKKNHRDRILKVLMKMHAEMK